MRLNILCFNIHGGYDMQGLRDLRRVHALMERYAIDIGVFQEIETRPSRGGALADIDLLAGPQRPHRLPGLTMEEDGGWYGNLIVSRFPILRGLVHDLATPRSIEPRCAVDALVDTPFGVLRLIGTHLSLTPWERRTELHSLVTLMDAVEEKEVRPTLLMGDINEWFPLARMLRHLNHILRPAPCGASFPSRFPVLHLDRVWHDRCSFPVQAEILKEPDFQGLSDHLPVLVRLGTV